ncbi:MAG TPA: XRE family transcriptional regulator [Alphaproteobacteria bacterium]|nr:XRE family transcriptional regulator [Alphaproteobacteria bacterium]
MKYNDAVFSFMTEELPLTHQELEGIQQQLSSFGARLRELRLQRGLTLQELAVRSGLSKAFLSRLESGSRQASISAVLTLSRIFHVSLTSLFEFPIASARCTIIRAADQVEKTVNGLKYTLLSGVERLFNVRPIRVKVPPSRRGHEHYHHDGEEWVYVLRGELALSIAGDVYDLAEGDAAHFEPRLPHRLIARGGREAEVLVVAAPNWSRPINANFKEHRAIPAGGFPFLPQAEPIPAPSAKLRSKLRQKNGGKNRQ